MRQLQNMLGSITKRTENKTDSITKINNAVLILNIVAGKGAEENNQNCQGS